MKTRMALTAICAALAAGCSSTPRWDTSVFPNQVVYDAAGSQPVPVATAPAK
jgi:hypothetical protein